MPSTSTRQDLCSVSGGNGSTGAGDLNTQTVDIELELGFVVGVGSTLGTPVSYDAFADHVFGVVGLNDWSARDIQAWEYVPLGPFLGKSFQTSIAAWVTPLSLLEDARVEELALRAMPGLRKLWQPFHVALPNFTVSAVSLMARLARALFDDRYEDDNPWVVKGRAMFAEHRRGLAEPAVSLTRPLPIMNTPRGGWPSVKRTDLCRYCVKGASCLRPATERRSKLQERVHFSAAFLRELSTTRVRLAAL